MRKYNYYAAILFFLLIPCTLSAQDTATLKGTVTDQSGEPLAGANVSLLEITMGSATETDGTYLIDGIEPGTYTLRVGFIGFETHREQITLEAGQTVTKNFSLQKTNLLMEESLVVIGSRANPVAASELAVPVDVITTVQIRATGTNETSQILAKVSPSINFPHQTVADGTSTARPFTLRGLSPDHVLVLINGKRRHPTSLVHRLGSGIQTGSSGVDMNAIPSNAISRIEVLRDGAAAQYGSDAIAGVVNIVLKSESIQPKLSAKLGAYTPSGYDTDGRTYTLAGQYGFDLGDRGFFNVFAQYRNQNPTNRAGADPRDQIVEGDADIVDENGNVVEKNNPVAQPNFHWGDPEAQNTYAWWNGEYRLSENSNTTLYTFGGYSYRSGLSQGFYRRSLDPRNWPQIYPLGFLPNFDTPVTDYSASLGLKGLLGEWNYDLNSVYGHNNYEFNITNSLNTSYGPNIPPNQTSFYAGSTYLTQWTNTLDMFRNFDIGLSTPLTVAFGAAFRYEIFGMKAGEPKSWNNGGFENRYGGVAAFGAQVFPGFTPENALEKSRNNISLYVDLKTNPFEELLVNVAGRFESYSDFGETIIGKVALRFQPTEALVFRGAAGTGFRAPNLSQQYFSKVSTTFIDDPETGETVPFQVGIFRTNSEVAKALGATPLDEEKSVNISGGFAFTPVSNFTITADYYLINIDDRIILSGNLQGPQVEALLAPYGAKVARYFSNAIDTRTQGIDITANYTFIVGNDGILSLNGAFNYNKTDVLGEVKNPPQLDGLEEQIFGFESRTGLTRGTPQTKARLTALYSNGRLNASLSAVRYGEVTAPDSNPEQVQVLSPKVLIDAGIGYQLIDQIKLSIGARNLFDVFPDKTIGVNSFNGIFPYPRISPFGFNGRFIYAQTIFSF